MGSSSSKQETSQATTDARLAVDGGGFGNTGTLSNYGGVNLTSSDPALVKAAYDFLQGSASNLLGSAGNTANKIISAGTDLSAQGASFGANMVNTGSGFADTLVNAGKGFAGNLLSTSSGATGNLISTGSAFGSGLVDTGKNFANDLLASADKARAESFKAGNDAVSAAVNAVGTIKDAQTGAPTFDQSQIMAALIGVAGLWLVTKH